MNIGNAIKQVRKYSELSQVALSKRTKLSQTSISLIEIGIKPPTRRNLLKICKGLRITEPILYILAMEETDFDASLKLSYIKLYIETKDYVIREIGKGESKRKASL